ncbi:MAG: hypothetical protein R2759_15255 [Bacteroidales bacterium]
MKKAAISKKGQPFYTIDPAPSNGALQLKHEQSWAEAKTILAKAESDVKRYRPLAQINAVAQSDPDAAEAPIPGSTSIPSLAQASLDYANIQLGYTKIYAPISGLSEELKLKLEIMWEKNLIRWF